MPVLCAFLWRLTGAGCGPWRKIGYPILIGLFGLTHGAAWWQIAIAIALAGFAVTRSFTYYGSEVSYHWFNWIWIAVLGLYFCAPMFLYGRLVFWPFAWVLAAYLSNIKGTAKVFTWEFCECLCGVTVLL